MNGAAHMATTTHTQPAPPPAPLASPAVYRMTVTEFERIAGLLNNDQIELVDGYVLTKRTRNRPHLVAGNTGLKALSRILPPGWYVAKRDPIVVSDWSKPEPDLAIVRGDPEDYLDHDVTAHDIALVIEIAESSLSIDQRDMARVYASSGIPVYWIVNLIDHQIEVYTNPGTDGYQSSEVFKPDNDVTLLIDGHEAGRLSVADILP